MIRFAAILLATILLFSCATVEESIEEDAEPVETEEKAKLPGWYDVSVKAKADNGQVTGFAKAIGSEASWAVVNAESQALSNLRFRVDDLLEEARREVVESDASADSRGFIIALRNSIADLDFEPIATFQTDTVEEEQSILAIAKAEADLSTVFESLGEEMSEYRSLWQLMMGTEIVESIKSSSL